MMLDQTALMNEINERLVVFCYSLFIALLTWSLAWRWGFFKEVFFQPASIKVKGKDVIKGFFIFLIAQALVVPALIVVVSTISHAINSSIPSSIDHKWLSLFVILGSSFLLFLFFFNLPIDERQAIWGDTSRWYDHLIIGILTWFVSYPFVLAVGQVVSLVVLSIFKQSPAEQVAVSQLKNIFLDRWLFGMSVIGVTCLVPLAEELLFRGLLQSWIKGKIKQTTWAIIITSFVFALFHYAPAQGITNIELLFSLFLLSCFLGFLYERQRSLWAPIGLHGFFNAMSVLLIVNNQ